MITFDTRNCQSTIDVPREVATCPICDGSIVVRGIDVWDEETGLPESVRMHCTTEPGIQESSWFPWMDTHHKKPYAAWIATKKAVLAWVQANFRCV